MKLKLSKQFITKDNTNSLNRWIKPIYTTAL